MASRGKTITVHDVKLTNKEFAFADAILRGLENIEAAREAGYSPSGSVVALSVAANRVLSNPSVQKYISIETKARELARRKAIEVDDLWVTQQFKEIYNRCMQRIAVMKFNKESGQYEQATDDNGEGVWTFDSNGAVRAMENIAKHIGYFEADNKQRAPVIKINIQRNNLTINNSGVEDEDG